MRELYGLFVKMQEEQNEGTKKNNRNESPIIEKQRDTELRDVETLKAEDDMHKTN